MSAVQVSVPPLPPTLEVIDEQNVEQAAERILFPEGHPRGVLQINGKLVKLRPLPIKHGRRLNSMTERLTDVGEITVTQSFDRVIATFIEAASYLLMYYGFPEMDETWVEEHLAEMDVRRIVDAQMEVESQDAFLPTLLRIFIENIKRQTPQMLAAATRSLEPPSSSVSAQPGTSDSTSS